MLTLAKSKIFITKGAVHIRNQHPIIDQAVRDREIQIRGLHLAVQPIGNTQLLIRAELIPQTGPWLNTYVMIKG